MTIVKFKKNTANTQLWGVVRNNEIFEIDIQMPTHREVMLNFFEKRPDFDAAIKKSPIAYSDVEICAPISDDVQLFCQGLNYADHRREGGLKTQDTDQENLIFAKAPSSICGPNDDIIRPIGCKLLDYEIELGLVMKSAITKPMTVKESDLKKLIGGLVMANDISSRDDQFGASAMQWFKGKSHRTFCPIGPYLYLLEDGDLEQINNFQLILKLNGTVKQNATTDLLIHKPAATLSEISSYANILAGDCILTGTPGGVLFNVNLKTALSILLNFKKDKNRRLKVVKAQLAQKNFMQPGDTLELSIKSLDGSIDLGTQKNIVVDANQ